jgi:hypothetical protein
MSIELFLDSSTPYCTYRDKSQYRANTVILEKFNKKDSRDFTEREEKELSLNP